MSISEAQGYMMPGWILCQYLTSPTGSQMTITVVVEVAGGKQYTRTNRAASEVDAIRGCVDSIQKALLKVTVAA